MEEIPPCILKSIASVVGVDVVDTEEAKSAQQRVFILHYDNFDDDTNNQPQISTALRGLLEAGGHRLVLRIWRGGSRWWNLNQARNIHALATAEVAGYRLAHKALGERIPRLVHVSLNNNQDNNEALSWALLEYVGQFSSRFDDTKKIYDQYWTKSMIKVRDEFGYSEPHPRWGRVPEKESLPYALRVLNQIILPLHRYMWDNHNATHVTDEKKYLCGNCMEESENGYTYSCMVLQYVEALARMKNSLESMHGVEGNDVRLSDSLEALAKCLDELKKQTVLHLPSVLLHMDCQPQNLVFARMSMEKDPWYISSLLDWEDSAYGDPRFELLLLGRKVCANLSQAESIWAHYEANFPHLELGPIAPWLQLETVHSLCTLLLQSMGLLEGGRSPWETQPDLWGKIEREFSRLVGMGWTFCQVVASGQM